jgi:conjugal transfer pilus assembly protein TraF
VEFEALQKRVEDLRNIAIINPSEQNIRNYLNIQNFVIEKASTFADVAQRVIWATPGLIHGHRPPSQRRRWKCSTANRRCADHTVAALQTHALFFFSGRIARTATSSRRC